MGAQELRLIPCPVCGGALQYGAWPLLEGEGLTKIMADCPQRHHATTPPHIWEQLRIEALLVEYRRAVIELSEADAPTHEAGRTSI